MASSSSSQHAVDIIDELSASTEDQLLMLPLSGENCIYSAPISMRSSNEQHFTPRVVSIGPIHYRSDKKLWGNEHLKKRYLAEFRKCTGISLKECYKLILESERKLRNCYADVVEFSTEVFGEMVLRDAAFLIMILVYNSCKTLISYSDQIFGKPEMIRDIVYDVVLLENQLPFFILEELYKLSKLQSIVQSKFDLNFNEETAMTVFAYEFLKEFMSPIVPGRHPPSNKPEHILDLYKSCLIPADWNPERHEAETTNIPSTKKLFQAGVEIQPSLKENMFDIRFNDGILEIPLLFIYDFSELVFRNLLAYELCRSTPPIFSDYFEVMRLLTVSSEDAELLIQNGAIMNGLPNAERVSTLFQNIGTGNIIDWSQFLYSDVIKHLDTHYVLNRNKWKVILMEWKEILMEWKATLKEKYCKVPWAICSVTAAVILLVLTIVQTIFTILQVVLTK